MTKLNNQSLELRNKIIEDNMVLAERIAEYYSSITNIPLDELKSSAYMGLIEAVEHFNLQSNQNFSAYTTRLIKKYINKTLSEEYGFESCKLYNNFINSMKTVEKQSGIKLSDDGTLINDVIELMSLSLKKQEEVRNTLLMYNYIVFDAENKELSDYTCDYFALESYTSIVYEYLIEVLKELSPRQLDIIKKRYGLEDGKRWTYSELSETYNRPPDKIMRIERKALERLRKPQIYWQLKELYEGFSEFDKENIPVKVKIYKLYSEDE